MILAHKYIEWLMKSNSSAEGPSINNMKTDRWGSYLYFYVVKASFKNCIFSKWISVSFVFVSFDNCSFYRHISIHAFSYLFGLSYNIAHVFLIRCDLLNFFDITVHDVESQIHIVQSRLIDSQFHLKITRQTSAVSPVTHLTIHDSIISDTSIYIFTDSTAVGIVEITNTILTRTVVTSIKKFYRSAHIAFFINNCTFIQSSLHSTRSVIVYIVNSRFDVECQTEGCAITLIGSGELDMRISSICDLYNIKTCYGIYLHNNELIGHGIYARFHSVVFFSADDLFINDSIM